MKRAEEIGSELYADGLDAMENMFYSIEFRIKEEIDKDAKPYRSWRRMEVLTLSVVQISHFLPTTIFVTLSFKILVQRVVRVRGEKVLRSESKTAT